MLVCPWLFAVGFSHRFTLEPPCHGRPESKNQTRPAIQAPRPALDAHQGRLDLGFRRGPDTWLARWRDRQGLQHYQPMGGPELAYDEAKAAAEGWLGKVSGSPVRRVKRGTVRAALEEYLADLRAHGRIKSAADTQSKFQTAVWGDPFAQIKLEELMLDDTMAWRARLQQGRANRSVNRLYRGVKAGLNRAQDKLGCVGDPRTWKLDALMDDVEDSGETAVFLDPAQRAAIIQAAQPAAAAFFQALAYTGSRPGEMAAATVGDLSAQGLRLAHHKGRSGKLRVRQGYLEPQSAAFFKARAKDKTPLAPLFTEDGVQPWRRHRWGRAMNAAIKAVNAKARAAARIPPTASAYSFRHARISELLQTFGVDPITVAIQCGTSAKMIEDHYFKFIPSAMKAKLAAARS